MIPRTCPVFLNRRDAGRHVALALHSCGKRDDVVVIALARGGIQVGLEVAYVLRARLDIVAVERLCLSRVDATQVGTISGSGACVFDGAILGRGAGSGVQLDRAIHHERAAIARVNHLVRGFVTPVPLRGRSVIVVGDGLDDEDILRAALLEVHLACPGHVTIAAPVLQCGIRGQLGDLANASVAVREPAAFRGGGAYYRDCRPISDAEFVHDLEAARSWQCALASHANPGGDVVHRQAALLSGVARRVAIATSLAVGQRISSVFR
ncbi:hypothetical protein [Burkholderia stagnalis]|uniref:hypothetical protein n=1 Tax=Burkholderia stagnalis TaxID=1503054 RepID=UPI000A65792C|nr:hypothetical protein [Burkholderia stagnalis]